MKGRVSRQARSVLPGRQDFERRAELRLLAVCRGDFGRLLRRANQPHR